MRDQRIRDPIHDLISFSAERDEDKLLWELLQTPQVQRLRRIKQLGFSEFVYPGATHSRFSHALGALQMARRMLAVLEKNKAFSAPQREHSAMRKATLAAALLHDIGHGPYSHVFEDLASSFDIDREHEAYTREMIEQPPISTILRRYGVFSKTKRFFEKELGYDAYGAIISSQMDCDRLDFLTRDRHHVGLRSAYIDLEWLFDSLRIEEIPIDPVEDIQQLGFVVLQKGQSVVEEFVMAYAKMYNSVYFHKTTRAVQLMVGDILKKLIERARDGNKTLEQLPLVAYILESRKRTLENYLRLDDSAVLHALHCAAAGSYGAASTLARRYFSRDLYKCLEMPTSPHGTMRAGLGTRFVKKLRDQEIEHYSDTLPPKGYKQYEIMDPNFVRNIFIKIDKELERLGDVSVVAQNVGTKRVRLYFPDEVTRDKATKALDKARLD
jgi:HD superfamily phosphohydrolase